MLNNEDKYRSGEITKNRYLGDSAIYFKIVEEDPFLKMIDENQDTIIDLGCGTGRLFHQLKIKAQTIIGVDISSSMLEEAKQSHPEIQLYEADFNNIPLPDSIADNIVCLGTFHMTRAEDLPFKELTRVLKSSGTLNFSFWNHEPWLSRRLFIGPEATSVTKEKMEKLLERNNFKIIEVTSIFFFPPNLIWPIYRRLPRYLSYAYLKFIIYFNQMMGRHKKLHNLGGQFLVTAKASTAGAETNL